ncbi:MAG TPA: hypothetical protein DCX46_00500 [Bacteroidetes bacterium]|nr:hypothetical protein [Bacteroidota bacterium]
MLRPRARGWLRHSMMHSRRTWGGTPTIIRHTQRDTTFDGLQGYVGKNPYFGCIAGRYANRIAKGKFTVEDGDTRNIRHG